MYPDLPDLTSCTPVFFETQPNTLTHANFLTEVRTISNTAPGKLTLAPAQPTEVTRRPPSVPALSASLPASEPTSSAWSEMVDPGDKPPFLPQPQPPIPGSSSPPSGQSQEQGSENAQIGLSTLVASIAGSRAGIMEVRPHLTTAPALIFPGRQTLRPSEPAATVSGHLISLVAQGMVSVRPFAGSEQQTTPGLTKVISMEQIARDGVIRGDNNVRIPAFGTMVVDTVSQGSLGAGQGHGPNTGSLGAGGSGSPGDSVGKKVSDLGAWIMSGLGVSMNGAGPGDGAADTGSPGGSEDGGRG
ncbi:Protein transport protein sec1 [Sphaceloma murrayae]|uniref:Protein transport protein sec1 n=1 Tax=Sphaceloma murrayae TaxID=2082308 RepID=A0A2K1QZM4_9PEZI|nr:Protein transport protein sec1 [Sphaceloma murrayae]